jgi:hypothetical protein
MGILEELRDEVHALNEKIEKQNAEIMELREKIQPSREVYTLKDLADLPGVVSLKALQNYRRSAPQRLPGHGKPDGFAHNGEAAWRRETVMAWLAELAPNPFGRGRGRPMRKGDAA